ncbi:helix-turn-helix transcriptional regulator [Azospirillum sp.]|uniref:helix-turn-helix transcriptional regulator n=1 Tax=Azospirillum sp. TaxID=34012 RepID=UPI002D4F2640|nr:helix-turn-helix transcriptional regulator [Azospirillum sp.]HYD67481.1 helix-turn-helix transcriptional regulator [Azospirillum sp.]
MRLLLGTDELESLERLGRTVRLARLRRNLSQEDLAQRMGVSRSSVVMLERGAPGTSVGILLKALSVFGYAGRLGEILANDPAGEEMELVTGRKRAGAKDDVADF